MKCITREKMKFNDIELPARTKCRIINPKQFTPDVPGVQVNIYVTHRYIPEFRDIKNDLEETPAFRHYTETELIGYVLHTKTNQIYIEPNYKYYGDYGLYDWQVERIFDDNIPKWLKEKAEETEINLHKPYKLFDVIIHLEDSFADWVQDECEFRTLDEEEARNYPHLEEGMSLLVSEEKFNKKKLEYQNRLEKTGFTYDFDGGLIWE